MLLSLLLLLLESSGPRALRAIAGIAAALLLVCGEDDSRRIRVSNPLKRLPRLRAALPGERTLELARLEEPSRPRPPAVVLGGGEGGRLQWRHTCWGSGVPEVAGLLFVFDTGEPAR